MIFVEKIKSKITFSVFKKLAVPKQEKEIYGLNETYQTFPCAVILCLTRGTKPSEITKSKRPASEGRAPLVRERHFLFVPAMRGVNV